MTPSIRAFFFLADLILLNISILASSRLTENDTGGDIWINLIYLLVFSNLSWLFLVIVSNPYNVTKGWTISRIFKSQIAFLFIHLLVVSALVVIFKKSYSPLQLGTIYLIFIPVFFLLKIGAFFIRKLMVGQIAYTNFLLVGRNELSNEVRKYFLLNPDTGYRFMGYLDFEPGEEFLATLREFCSRKEVHEIYCCVPDAGKSSLQDLVAFGLDSLIRVKFMVTSSQESLHLSQYDQMPALDVATVPLDSSANQRLKRLFDITFSLLFNVLVMSWLVPIVAILIKLNSPGPVFFVQLRNGEQNKPFKCLKFRTMVVNNESDSKQATKGDSRITSVGKFLRKTSIDELPQFLNVMAGDMSIIGPRPHPIQLNQKFAPLISNIMSRHYVKPGITGLAQCMGYRGETSNFSDMENRVRLDRYYIENWTFWLDIKIIFLTVVSLIRGSDKAY